MKSISVAVIGGGPGGLSFCHAIERQARQQRDGGGIEISPPSTTTPRVSVRCFERSTGPGGVWKSADPSRSWTCANMYDELWTNGPSHSTEFADYTFDEHFGRPVTVYMPRQEVLGYLIGRVTNQCPDFFEKYFQFGTAVQSVKWDAEKAKFIVVTRSTTSPQDSPTEHYFDKVVWACGDNGKPFIPKKIKSIFRSFQGRAFHSSDTATLESDFRGKRVLMIGGGYSAEDLALQACKLGVEKVFISSREESSDGTVMGAWPYNKVEVLRQQTPVSVAGRTIRFSPTKWTWDDEYVVDSETISTELCDIDTVVFCTGYKHNYEMLDDGLYPETRSMGYPLEVPENWTMPPNMFSEFIPAIKPGKTSYYTQHTHPQLYQGLLVSNPNMMFINTYGSEQPLLAVDVSAWTLARFCNGGIPIPSEMEMNELNRTQALRELELPFLRYYMDENYHKALNRIPAWGTDELPVWQDYVNEETQYNFKLLARKMQYSKYMFEIGTSVELNKLGRLLYEFDCLSDAHRYGITNKDIELNPWKTFRDYENAKDFFSIHTGTKAVCLPKPWLQIDHPPALQASGEEKKSDP